MKAGTYQIQTMELSDFAAVSRLWRATNGIGLNESDTKPNIAIYLKRNPGMSFVVRKGKIIVGAVLCGHDGRRGYLHHLAVSKKHRGNQLGKRLVEACFVKLANAGITRCNIYLFSSNSDGEAFWKHNGWKKRGDLQVLQKAITGTRYSRCAC